MAATCHPPSIGKQSWTKRRTFVREATRVNLRGAPRQGNRTKIAVTRRNALRGHICLCRMILSKSQSS
jgi:hypothetical protein